jgi:hypothetical protein
MDSHRAQLPTGLCALVEKWPSIFDWEVPEVDEPLSYRLLLEVLRQALDDVDAESCAVTLG